MERVKTHENSLNSELILLIIYTLSLNLIISLVQIYFQYVNNTTSNLANIKYRPKAEKMGCIWVEPRYRPSFF
jgi:hypothetical protein